ncbi:hypothetical protein MP228_004607 [Amoeboaphelidium protococcarum]|nr:hypothetical protein MP228_004607 [Amoeboaphelidium protococcarum]
MGWMAVSRPIRSPFPVHQAFWIMLFHLFNCPCRIGGICQNKLCLASADFLYVSIGNPSGPGDLLFGALLRAFSSSSIVMGLTSDQFSLSQIYLLLNDALKLSRMFCYAAGSVSSFEYRFWQNLWAIQSIWSVVYQEAPFESFNDWMSVLTNFGFIISKLNFDDTSPNYWYLALNLSWFFLERSFHIIFSSFVILSISCSLFGQQRDPSFLILPSMALYSRLINVFTRFLFFIPFFLPNIYILPAKSFFASFQSEMAWTWFGRFWNLQVSLQGK